MGILLKYLRIKGFRGLENIEIDFEKTTVMVGANNSGKTTILKALQLVLTNSIKIIDDDFYLSEEDIVSDKIVIDTLFISIDNKGNQVSEFEQKWADVFTAERITIDSDNNEVLAFRTIVKEDPIRKTFSKQQYQIDIWNKFKENDIFWYEQEYDNKLSFYFNEIPFFYLDANRDILEDLKSKTSYLGQILSSIKYEEKDRNLIEGLIKQLNEETISRSLVLGMLEGTLKELDTTMDNSSNSVSITPFTKKLRDLNKGVKINYSDFAMDYHGMGTRSWSSLLILKAFIEQNQLLAMQNQVAFFPIIAIEEPESHLHPNAQKKLYRQITNIKGQKIISTHSNYIAGNAKLNEIRGIHKESLNKVSVKKFLLDRLSDEDVRKIERQVINTRGEVFFSKLVVLFEGETEEQALPIMIEKYFDKSVIELGINLVGVGGSGGYSPFIHFFEALCIKYLIFSDAEDDAKEKVGKQIEKSKQKNHSLVVYLSDGNDFEKELCNCGYIEEVKAAYLESELTKCTNKKHKEAKTKEIERISDDKYCELIKNGKTKFAPLIADKIIKSNKELPSKVIELCEKIASNMNI